MPQSFKALLIVVLFLFVLANTRADVMNLNEHMPTRLEDASVVDTGEIQIQASTSYQDKEKRFHYRPDLRWGMMKRVQTELMLDQFSGPRDKEKTSGQTAANIQWNFNDQDNIIPSMAITSEFKFPTGKNTDGIDPSLRLNLTNTIAGTLSDPEVQAHVNYRWSHNSVRQKNESKVGNLLVAGLSQRLSTNSALIADFAHEKDTLDGKTSNEVEVGWLREAARKFQIGVSAGVDIEKGYFSSTLAIQKSF